MGRTRPPSKARNAGQESPWKLTVEGGSDGGRTLGKTGLQTCPFQGRLVKGGTRGKCSKNAQQRRRSRQCRQEYRQAPRPGPLSEGGPVPGRGEWRGRPGKTLLQGQKLRLELDHKDPARMGLELGKTLGLPHWKEGFEVSRTRAGWTRRGSSVFTCPELGARQCPPRRGRRSGGQHTPTATGVACSWLRRKWLLVHLIFTQPD